MNFLSRVTFLRNRPPFERGERPLLGDNYGRACDTLRIDERDVDDNLIVEGLAVPSGRQRAIRASGKSPASIK